MSLRDTTVAKLVDATRTPNAPVVHIVGEAEQHAMLESFQKELRNVGIGCYFLPFESAKGLNLKVDLDVDHLLPETDEHYNWYYHFLELLFVGDTLQMNCGVYATMRLVTDVPHVVRIVQAIKTRLQAQWKQKQKKEKIFDLRVRAIQLQVLAIAKRLDLGCQFERLHRYLWVHVFDHPLIGGVGANIPLYEPPHDHIAKLEKDSEKLYQRMQEEERQQAAREMQK